MLVLLPVASLAALGQAQGAPPIQDLRAGPIRVQQSLDDLVRLDDLEVRGRRGAGLIAPEIELDGYAIDALGAWDIGEALQRLAETYGIGDAPMVVVNGKRVANPGAFTGFPPNALMRMEILPAQAASLYGGAPGQRVVNLVLHRQFQSYDGRVSGGAPTQGGTSSLAAELRRSAIEGERTLQLGARVSRDTALLSSERQRGEVEDPRATTTVRPASDLMALNMSNNRPIGDWSAAITFNGQVRKSSSRMRFGDQVINNIRQNDNLGASLGLSGTALGWRVQMNATGQAARASEKVMDKTRSESRSIGLNGSAGRTFVDLPAGPLIANFTASFMENRSTIERFNQYPSATSFQASEAKASVTVPFAKSGEKQGLLRGIGDAAVTVGAGFRDTGTGAGDEVNASVSWTPQPKVRLNGLWSASNDSIAENLRSEPSYYDAPRVVFDFQTGQAEEIVPIMGGNPNLQQPRSERVSLMASLGPFTEWGVFANLGFQRNKITNGISPLPDLTADIERIFPDRFVRDAAGRLTSIDYRPLNLSANLTETLSSSLNFNFPRPAGRPTTEATTVRFAMNHSYRLRNTLELTPGLPILDRLRGDGGGLSKQDARLLIDARKGAWGLNATVRWQDGYRTRKWSGLDGERDLLVAPLTTADLALSFRMMARAQAGGGGGQRSSGLQIIFQITNLFDERPSASLGNGIPAPGYGRDDQDLLGRSVKLSLQRRF